jgi:hypothetical protein
VPVTSGSSKHAFVTIKPSSSMWHRYLAHPSSFVVQQLLRKNIISFTPEINPYVCDYFQLAKSHQLPYPISTSVFTVSLEQVFFDVWGPTPVSVYKHAYYVSFIDDFSIFTWIYLLKKFLKFIKCSLTFSNWLSKSSLEKLSPRKLIG